MPLVDMFLTTEVRSLDPLPIAQAADCSAPTSSPGANDGLEDQLDPIQRRLAFIDEPSVSTNMARRHGAADAPTATPKL